jgi:hypothetical protein
MVSKKGGCNKFYWNCTCLQRSVPQTQLILTNKEVTQHGLNGDSVYSTTINQANVWQTGPLISPQPHGTVLDTRDEQVTPVCTSLPCRYATCERKTQETVLMYDIWRVVSAGKARRFQHESQGVTVPGSVTQLPCSWHIQVWRPGPSGRGTLESERVISSHESCGAQTREWLRWQL